MLNSRLILKGPAGKGPAGDHSEPHEDAAALARMRRASPADLQKLKARDNTSNIGHLAFVWLVIVLAIGCAITIENELRAGGHSLIWLIPVVLVAIVIVGASQHQLGGAIHEGTHHTLFANRRLNELVSDWLAAFPIYTSTYQFRVHHLAHHQFVNDPERDPDISQLKESDHWLDFPITHIDMVRALARQLWLPNLIRYTIVRAKYSALGFDKNPYRDDTRVRRAWSVRAGLLFAVLAPAAIIALLSQARGGAAFAALGVLYALVAGYYLALAADTFPGTQLQPVISHRATALGRVTFMALVYASLTGLEVWVGVPAWSYFGLYWIVPLFTTFALFMVLRQWVQHGNADRGRYTNTRVFLVNPLVRYAVFPFGMDYHLPHHLYASVPHYNLKALHALLLGDGEYRAKGVIVEGYFGDDNSVTGRPSALSVIGPKHVPRRHEAAHIDNAALELVDVKDQDAISREVAASQRQAGTPPR